MYGRGYRIPDGAIRMSALDRKPPSNPSAGPPRGLVEQAQQGNAQALNRLMELLDPVLRSFFRKRLGGNRSEIDDLVQNTLLRVIHSLHDLREPDRLKSFTLRAAIFELQDLFRGRYAAREERYQVEVHPEPSHQDPQDIRLDVQQAVAQLPERTREILELKEIGYKYQEIALMLGLTESAIKMQVKRAYERLQEILSSTR